jgi:hypothetical protein
MAQMWRPKGRFDAAQGSARHGRDLARPALHAARACRLSSNFPACRHGADLSILHAHTASFPMLMAMLSHPAFPLPIWRVLQVRNRTSRNMKRSHPMPRST